MGRQRCLPPVSGSASCDTNTTTSTEVSTRKVSLSLPWRSQFVPGRYWGDKKRIFGKGEETWVRKRFIRVRNTITKSSEESRRAQKDFTFRTKQDESNGKGLPTKLPSTTLLSIDNFVMTR